MQQVWNMLKAAFGTGVLTLCFLLLYSALISLILYRSIKPTINLKRIGLVVIICSAGFIFGWRQPYFSERMHVAQFALLGWLVMRDLNKDKKIIKAVFLAFIFVAIIACLEEGLQKLLPWRVCEIRDITTDILSGLFGISLFLATKTKK